MTKKRAWLRVCGRWGVWVCTFFILVGLVCSAWMMPGMKVQYVQRENGHPWQQWASVGFAHGRFVTEYMPKDGFSLHGPGPKKLGWNIHVENNFSLWWGQEKRWWIPPRYRIVFVDLAYQWSIPLAYPALLMSFWSGWLVRGVNRQRRLIGCCDHCGYSLEGLGGGVCPECGEGDEE